MSQGYELPLIVTGTRIGLGPLERDLLPLYQRWMNDLQIQSTLGVTGPFSFEREQNWYERNATAANAAHFTIYELSGGRPVGTTSLMEINHRHRCADFGIMIGERDCWNRGYGTEAARLMLDYGFTILNLHNISLTVFSNNPRGLRAYEKAGFKQIGRRREAYWMAGEAFDVIYMDAIATEYSGSAPVRDEILHAQRAKPAPEP